MSLRQPRTPGERLERAVQQAHKEWKAARVKKKQARKAAKRKARAAAKKNARKEWAKYGEVAHECNDHLAAIMRES